MKIRCTRTDSPGLLGGPRKEVGLTVGNVYHAAAVPYGAPLTGSTATDTFQFLVFNDQQRWELYPLTLFEPVD